MKYKIITDKKLKLSDVHVFVAEERIASHINADFRPPRLHHIDESPRRSRRLRHSGKRKKERKLNEFRYENLLMYYSGPSKVSRPGPSSAPDRADFAHRVDALLASPALSTGPTPACYASRGQNFDFLKTFLAFFAKFLNQIS